MCDVVSFTILTWLFWGSFDVFVTAKAPISMRFAQIDLNQSPSLLSYHYNINDIISCAHECASSYRARCRGYQVFNNACYLFKGTVEEKDASLSSTQDELAYKLVYINLPACTSHTGFQVVHTPDDTFCFYPNNTIGDYHAAKDNCNSRGGIVAFIDTLDKLEAARGTLSQDPRRDIDVGLHYDSALDEFVGEEDGQVVYRSNSLWRDGEPSWPQNCPCVMSTGSNQYNDIPCNVAGFQHVCEITDIF